MSRLTHSVRRSGLQVAAKLGADLLGRLLLFLLFIVAARTLPFDDFGRYAFALAVGLILAQLADAGLQLTLLRRLSSGPLDAAAGRALGTALVARTAVAIPLSLAAIALALSAGGEPADVGGVLLIALSTIVLAFMDTWAQVLRAAERLELEALVMLIARALLAALGTLALLAYGTIGALSIAYALSALVGLGLAAAAGLRYVRPQLPARLAEVRAALAEALPVAVAGAASLLMFRIDVVLLQWLLGAEAVATYGAAFRLFEASLLIPVAVMALAFPQLVRAARQPHRFGRLVRRTSMLLVAAGLLLMAGGWVLGGSVIDLAFGPGFGAAAPVLDVLVAAIPLMFVNAVLTHALVALARAWRQALAMIVALAVNVALNLALIPQVGELGAAAASVAAEAALLVGCLVALRRGASGAQRGIGERGCTGCTDRVR